MRAAFGPFSFDLHALELKKNGVRLRLEEKPARLLACLIQRKGEIVTREELRKSLWPDDVNLNFDHGLNKAVNKVRTALADDTANPKYLETLSKRGYRFIHALELDSFCEMGLEPVLDESPATVPDDSEGDTRSSVPSDSSLQVGGPHSEAEERTLTRMRLSLAAALVALVIVVPAIRRLGALFQVRPIASKHIRVPAELWRINNGDAALALSPDGMQVAFAAAGTDRRPKLWLFDLRSSQVRELPGTEGGTLPFWSPDGTRLGFFTPLELKTIDINNFSIKLLAPVESARGGSWSSRGVILFAPETRGPIFRIPAEGGAAIPVTALDLKSNATTNRWPAFLSDEDHFVYLEANHNSPEAPGRVMLGSLQGGGAKFLLESDSDALPARDKLMFVLHRQLVSVHLNKQNFEPASQAKVIAEGIDCDRGSWYCPFALSRTGVLYRPGKDTANRETISWFDAAGNKLADLGRPGVYRSVDLSPDGKTIAASCGDPDEKVCLIHENGTTTQLDSGGLVSGSIWAPDSSAIAYLDHRSISDYTFLIQSLSRPGSSPAVIEPQFFSTPIAWHPRGRIILYKRDRLGADHDLGFLDLKTGDTSPYLSGLASEVNMARFSPDGRWVAFDRQTNGTNQIYIASFPNPSNLFPLTTEGGCAPKWRGDGKAIFYLGPGDVLYSISLIPSSAGFEIGKPTPLFRPPVFFAPWNCNSFDVTRDGSRFVINVVASPITQELVWMAY